MGEVVVKINGRDFPLTCTDGQESRTRRLAQYVDGKIAEFSKNLGQIGEARLLLLAALIGAQAFGAAQLGLRTGSMLGAETREWAERFSGALLMAAAVLVLLQR